MALGIFEVAFGFLIGVPLVMIWIWACDRTMAWRSPSRRLLRQRRRHATRTVRAMRKMTKIRVRTVQQMDAVERSW
jgi:hypothetical protein